VSHVFYINHSYFFGRGKDRIFFLFTARKNKKKLLLTDKKNSFPKKTGD
jgi:hypothetical protein